MSSGVRVDVHLWFVALGVIVPGVHYTLMHSYNWVLMKVYVPSSNATPRGIESAACNASVPFVTITKQLSLLIAKWFAIIVDLTCAQLAVAIEPHSGERRCQDFKRAIENCSDATWNCCTDEYISSLIKCSVVLTISTCKVISGACSNTVTATENLFLPTAAESQKLTPSCEQFLSSRVLRLE
ncbi:hypothetical protein CPB85DRAFT_1253765 [Mucidula mucida]|nr:hypothetical protein CPB85DRAFT_1253765 [Mucidula mucida]